MKNGLRLLWRNPILRPLALSAAHFNLFTAMFFALYTLYVIRELQLSAFLLGVATMFGGVGGVIAATCTGWLGRTFGMGRVLVFCSAAPALPVCSFRRRAWWRRRWPWCWSFCARSVPPKRPAMRTARGSCPHEGICGQTSQVRQGCGESCHGGDEGDRRLPGDDRVDPRQVMIPIGRSTG
ncbi:MAG TPA: hypothetical protein VFV67_27305 [Actinophytocola sp.]|uniref:hypothetical protein n=1 Tax=Actinophytocola sp. TaxID=1872138 RepID=UPI002DBCA58A|nr:hypothetical protein [Actinophytocola sp.]HEU5474372.1 hypothetical protein [Actinophytocola sp.]